MSVSALLQGKPSRVITVSDSEPVADAARRLMEHGIGGLPVVDARGVAVGFLAERDVVAAVTLKPEGLAGIPVREVMRSPAPVCHPADRLPEVMSRMTRERLRHLVVMGDDGILGVISVGDLVKHRLMQLETEAGVLRDYVAAQRARGP